MNLRRSQLLERLDGSFDLLIVGGGITGAGMARDAARRGLRVALVEQADIANGASSGSSKLVHGGLRYLQQGHLGLVYESVKERQTLLDIAPHLVRPIPWVFPVYEDTRPGIRLMDLGLWFYEALSWFRSPELHRRMTLEELGKEVPGLDLTGIVGALRFLDCATDDARLTLENALDAVGHGAVVATWSRVVGFPRGPDGRVRGAEIEDVHTGVRRSIEASVVVNATGPWTELTRALAGSIDTPILRPTKGIHLVFDAGRVPVPCTVAGLHPADSRPIFVVPWGDRTYIGTTDTDHSTAPDDADADAEDARYLLAAINHLFPTLALGPEDVVATWAGVRPLIGADPAQRASRVSREHQVVESADGLLTVAGGKLTTYRHMAEELVDRVLAVLDARGLRPAAVAPCDTATSPLPGAVGWSADLPEDPHLVATYGGRARDVAALVADDPALGDALVCGRPEILAQVDYAVHHELACTVSDVLRRRTQLFFRDAEQGLGAARLVAQRMATLEGWSDERTTREIARYEAEVARSRAWREPTTPRTHHR